MEESLAIPAQNVSAGNTDGIASGIAKPVIGSPTLHRTTQDAAWRGEVSQRFKAYRTRRRQLSSDAGQSRFSFDEFADKRQTGTSLATEEPPASTENDFSFTIAIGRPSEKLFIEESPMEIDVSLQPEGEGQTQTQPVQAETKSQPGLYPIASIDDRRLAAIIDLFCLLFAYGGFLGLFGSLGGHFTLSNLSVAVGMMLRGLQVVSFSGEPPTPKQMLLRSAGYLLSAGTIFLGFMWAMWDEDELTWHDRLSRTYLSVEQTLADMETSGATESR
ncbi:MAG: hypothetical protein AUG13_04705 [Chloroflexi bacterium 13_1_20CM_2_59_7]|nr:MAG: hypothetical protein AUG13_04705 [Chloroflexi bacterium 13_1_20CM_2_59_7]